MPRTAISVDAILRDALADVLRKITPVLRRHVEAVAAEELENALSSDGATRSRRSVRPRRSEDLTRWVADRNARRVPKFVIEMTGGLDTKKKIVAKYGENAAFEKGKSLPKAKG